MIREREASSTARDTLTARDKGLPDRAVGLSIAEFLATGPRLDEFWTPLLALDDAAMTANVATMASWCADIRGASSSSMAWISAVASAEATV